MKSQIVLVFVVFLGLALVFGAVALWQISSNTEFSRSDAPQSAPAASEQ